MAVDGGLGPKREPRFLDLGAPDLAVDSNEVAKYAADFGNYVVDTAAKRLAASAWAWPGLQWRDSDATKSLWTFVGGAWAAGAEDAGFKSADAFANGGSAPASLTFASLPTIPVSLATTVAGPCKAIISLNVQALVSAGYMDIGVAVSGATTIAANETAPGVTPLGAILDLGPLGGTFPASLTKLVSLNAGLNTFTVQALIGGAGGTKTISNPYLTVRPA